jgi:hypothetical protein
MDIVSSSEIEKFHYILRQLRVRDKARENAGKDALCSGDVLNTGDFTFSKSALSARVGDSGDLLLAKRKTDSSERYLVKHAFTHCAVCEYVYSKLCGAMDVKTPQVKLFAISPGEKRKCFKTEYIMGAVYYGDADTNPSLEAMQKSNNWHDYFRCRALEIMFDEVDGIEFILTADGYLYRVDTSEAFPVNRIYPAMFTPYMDLAGINEDIDGSGQTLKEIVKNALMSDDLARFWHADILSNTYQRLRGEYGADALHFLEPLERIQSISGAYIDDFLNTLCYFYPDFIGDYFKRYISAAQSFSAQALLVLKRNG